MTNNVIESSSLDTSSYSNKVDGSESRTIDSYGDEITLETSDIIEEHDLEETLDNSMDYNFSFRLILELMNDDDLRRLLISVYKRYHEIKSNGGFEIDLVGPIKFILRELYKRAGHQINESEWFDDEACKSYRASYLSFERNDESFLSDFLNNIPKPL